jgi:hypothetical protein
MQIVVNKPTSLFFKPNQKGVLTVYTKGIVYAVRPFKEEVFKINIPFTGTYTFNGECDLIRQTNLQKCQNVIELPTKERNKLVFVKKVVFDDISSPARIYTDEGVIIINQDWLNYPIENRFFILLHELGHFYYTTEWKCDTFAAHHFIKLGFNPSQAFESIAGVLCPNKTNDHRIQNILTILKKSNEYK